MTFRFLLTVRSTLIIIVTHNNTVVYSNIYRSMQLTVPKKKKNAYTILCVILDNDKTVYSPHAVEYT